MAELRINTTGKLSLFDADDSHAASIVAGTVTANENVMSLATAGVTFAADVIVGDDLTLSSDSAVVSFGADADTTLTHTDGTGLTLNSTNKLCFNDATQFIQGASGTVLDIAATDEIELTATLLDVNANLDVSGTSLLPTLGVITAKDLGVGIHVRTADSGSAAASYADELVLENSTHCGLTICSSNSTTGNIYFGDGAGAAAYRGMITYDHNTDDMTFNTSAAEVFRIYDLIMATGDETAGDVTGGGICLQQKATDGNAISLKSSDVAHGITDMDETDTYATLQKNNASEGGLRIRGFGESSEAVLIEGGSNGENTTNGTSGVACVQVDAQKASGTDKAPLGADGNIFGASNDAGMKFIVKGDGDIYYDGADQGAYDTYEDAQLVRALDLSRTQNLAGVINSKFDEYINYNHETLAKAKLVGREKDGTPNHFINVTGMQRLHNGAIWQQYEKHEKLLNAFYKLAEKTIGKDEATKLLEDEEIKLLN